MFDHFPDFSPAFFSLIESEISEQANQQIATEYNTRYNDVNRGGNPQRENEMDSLSFEDFHAQLDCKFTHGNRNDDLV